MALNFECSKYDEWKIIILDCMVIWGAKDIILIRNKNKNLPMLDLKNKRDKIIIVPRKLIF